jgi:hypothetical protein
MAAVRFLEVEAEPDGCQLSAPLLLTWRYTAAEAIPTGWTWALTYVFDVAYDAREQRLGGCACAPCQPGSTHDAQASCDGIDTAGVPDRRGCGVCASLLGDCALTRRSAACSTTSAC